ncbi:MAG: hypothetical protein JXR95_13995 [Deltaproteobacteria bacterium]|nr:hypothetical protein [Deltaproteobacteria bacterium]
MKRTVLFFMIIMASVFGGCDDDSSSSDCTDTGCDAWEACSDTGDCILSEGRCYTESDCEDGVETCSEDHYCEVIPECTDNEDCLDSAFPVCDENGQCIAEEVSCNTEKTPSDIILSADECGEYTDCIDSNDCADGQRCENLPVDGEDFSRACCVDGPRGCMADSEICGDEFDCDSGLCIARFDTYYCTSQCVDENDCESPISECYDMFVMTVCVEPGE